MQYVRRFAYILGKNISFFGDYHTYNSSLYKNGSFFSGLISFTCGGLLQRVILKTVKNIRFQSTIRPQLAAQSKALLPVDLFRGIDVSTDLSWSPHIIIVTSKAKKWLHGYSVYFTLGQ